MSEDEALSEPFRLADAAFRKFAERTAASDGVTFEEAHKATWQLYELGHLRLAEDDRPLRVDSGPDPVGEHLDPVLVDAGHVLVPRRKGVQVDDAVDALVLVLEGDPVLQRPEPVADVQPPGRPHAGENALPGARRSAR